MITSMIIFGYLVMSVITAIVYASSDPNDIVGKSPLLMAWAGAFWPLSLPAILIYLTLGLGSRWLYRCIRNLYS